MKIVKPFAQLWEQKDIEEHIIKCAKVCYCSDIIPDNKHIWLQSKWNAGHKSIFRHGTSYFAIPTVVCNDRLEYFFKFNPYIGYCKNENFIFISVNNQTYKEHSWFRDLFKYNVSELELMALAENDDDKNNIVNIFRRTVYYQTQISTSRKLNRVSPNNICEQSTRYCNYTADKFDGQVAICESWWLREQVYNAQTTKNILNAMEIATNCYNNAVKNGVKPQDARGILPLDTATKCVYTYRVEEWAHILDLRYYGKAGVPHPNAKCTANQIREVLNVSLPENPNYKDLNDKDYFPFHSN